MMSTRTIILASLCAVGLAGCQDAPPPAPAPAATPPPAAEVAMPTMLELDRDPPRHILYRPDDVEWRDGPGSLEPGASFAVLEGDPTGDGVFTMQLRLPDGFVINPHTHPNVERVTVLQGVFRLGMGTTVDRDAATALPAGSYTSMPRGMVHHAIADGETIVQLTSVGPWIIEYVDPADDPRRRDY